MVMPKLKKRLYATVMLCALLLSLSSCLIVVNQPEDSKDPTGTSASFDDTTAPKVTEDVQSPEKMSENENASHRLDAMLDYDMDGKTIILVTTDSNVPLPVGSTRILDKTRWQILNDVSDKYGAELVVTRETRSKMLSKFLEASNSGLYYADILCAQSAEMGSLFAERLITDLSSLPFLDLDAEYYYSMASESVTVNGNVYGVAGEASVDYDTFGCMLVNIDALNSLGADVYGDVESGNWTYDKLLEYAKLYEYSEDGSYKGVNAVSSVFDKALTAEYLFEAMGTRYVYSDNGEMKLYSPVGTAADAVAAIRSICYTGNWGFDLTDEEKNKYIEEDLGDPADITQLDMLMNGKGLFCVATLNDLARIYYAERALVPLPMPKLDKGQGGYVTPTVGEACFFFLPADGANITESAILIEALNARSYGAISEAYITNVLHYYARNEKTLDMIGIVIDRPYFDLAVNFGTRYGALRQVAQNTVVFSAENGYSLFDLHGAFYSAAEDVLAEIKNSR